MVRPAVFFIFLCGALSGYLAQQDWQQLLNFTATQVATISAALPETTTPTDPSDVSIVLESLTLEQKVGQLLMVGHWAQDYFQHTRHMLTTYQFGGIIIMDVDDKLASTVPIWTDAWQNTSNIPLLISIDQEGGVVSRLTAPGYLQTSQRSIGTSEQAYDVGNSRGQELASLGINTNLAPVIDFASTSSSFLYGRSFATSSLVSDYAAAMILGHAKSNVLAIPKHFPGHADNPDDSHFTLPIVDITAAEFPAHVKQFRDLLQTTQVDALMTAHVQFPKLDDQYPATLSYEILSRQLRRDLGFDGVIITDDMTMKAITNQWTTNDAAVQAIKAGADIILFAAEPNAAMQAHDHLVAAVKSGDLSEELVDQAVTRVLELKQKQGLLP